MRTKRARRPKFFNVTIRVERPSIHASYDRVIGFAVAHPDGKGMNIFLDALQRGNQMTIRDPLANIQYGAGLGNDLRPVDWPPDHIGTPIKSTRKARRETTRT